MALWPGASVPHDDDRPVDVEVRIVESAVPPAGDEPFELLGATARYRTPQGDMRVQAGRVIEWIARPGASSGTLSLITAGPGLAMALAQREQLVLHGASVVSEAGMAVCLAGASGAGKSSLSAALLSRGWRLLSDGMSVISFDHEGRPWVQPGPAHMKLWPDAVRRLGHDADEFARVLPEYDKRLVPVSGSTALSAARLSSVLLVETGPSVELSSVTGAASLVGLVRVHFLSEYVGTPSAARLMRVCARLSKQVAVGRLRRGERDAQIGEALDAICGWCSSPQPP